MSSSPTPRFRRTMSVTRFGVSVENVVATIETPSSHQGWLRPARKNAEKSLLALRATRRPIQSENARKLARISQSGVVRCTVAGHLAPRHRADGPMPQSTRGGMRCG